MNKIIKNCYCFCYGFSLGIIGVTIINIAVKFSPNHISEYLKIISYITITITMQQIYFKTYKWIINE